MNSSHLAVVWRFKLGFSLDIEMIAESCWFGGGKGLWVSGGKEAYVARPVRVFGMLRWPPFRASHPPFLSWREYRPTDIRRFTNGRFWGRRGGNGSRRSASPNIADASRQNFCVTVETAARVEAVASGRRSGASSLGLRSTLPPTPRGSSAGGRAISFAQFDWGESVEVIGGGNTSVECIRATE